MRESSLGHHRRIVLALAALVLCMAGNPLLGQQGQTVRKRMLEIAFGQRGAPVLCE